MKENLLLSLRDLIQLKKTYLEDMLLFSQEQSYAIENEENEKLIDVLDKKDSLIEQIDKIDLEFKSKIEKEFMEDQVLSKILSEINDIFNKIKILDDKNNKKLQIALDEMKLNLKDVRKGKRAMSNYSNSDPYQSFVSQGGTLFIDQDS